MKEQMARFLQTRFINPMVRRTAGSPGSRYALLETTGRKSGVPRQTPVGNGLQGNVFWIVSEQGVGAFYVKNLVADPHVRIKVGGTWRTGHARVAPDEDPSSKLQLLDPRTAAEIRRMGSHLKTVKVDLDPAPA